MEAMSGFSLSDVVVHRNSAEPARIGAAAFTKGDQIHLAPGQERHLAHEAWHVVQQKQGRVRPTLQLKGGLSLNGEERLEDEADVMAARIFQAVPAVPREGNSPPSGAGLRRGGAGRGGDVIQRVWNKKDGFFAWDAPLDGVCWFAREDGQMWFEIPDPAKVRAEVLNDFKSLERRLKSWDEWNRLALAGKIGGLSSAAPKSGANLWSARNANAELYLLGTSHGLRLHQMDQGTEIGRFLATTTFTHVLSEVPGSEGEHLDYSPNLADQLQQALAAEKEMAAVLAAGAGGKAKALAIRNQSQLQGLIGKKHTLPLDEAYYALAASKRKDGSQPKMGYLDTAEGREEAYRSSNASNVPARSAAELEAGTKDVQSGNQQRIFAEQAMDLLENRDTAGTEQRNAQWLNLKVLSEGGTQLWIVGAAHLPGLIIRLSESGWNVVHVDLHASAQNAASSLSAAGIPPKEAAVLKPF
jgi:hypothetical protein